MVCRVYLVIGDVIYSGVLSRGREHRRRRRRRKKPCFVPDRLSQGWVFSCVAIPPALLHVSVWRLSNDGDVVWPEDIPGLSPGSPRVILGLSPGYPQVIPGLSMSYPRVIPGLSLGYPGDILAYPRVIHGLSWVIEYPWGVWVTPGYPRLSVGHPWVIPGLSGGCEASYPEGVRPHIQRM